MYDDPAIYTQYGLQDRNVGGKKFFKFLWFGLDIKILWWFTLRYNIQLLVLTWCFHLDKLTMVQET